MEHLVEYRARGTESLIRYEDYAPYVRLTGETKALLSQKPSPHDTAPDLGPTP
jgi:hypothetical protein